MFLQFILRRMWRPLNTFPLNPSQENMIACRSSILELTYFSLDRHCCAFLQGKKKKKEGASGGRGLWWCGEEGRRGWERKQKKKKKRWTEGRGAEKWTTGEDWWGGEGRWRAVMASGRETAWRGAECRSAVCSHEPTSLQHDIICAVKGGKPNKREADGPASALQWTPLWRASRLCVHRTVKILCD